MTSPQPELLPQEQNAVLGSMTTLLLSALPDDWGQLFLDFRAAGGYVEDPVSVLTLLGQSVDWTPPDEVLPFLLRLREGMYREGQGTWLSAKYHLARPNTYSVQYDWDDEPRWTHQPSQRFFADELTMFPRADENIPDWLRDRAGLPSRLYDAPVFDGADEHGTPLLDRSPVDPRERDEVLAYLENAPVVLAARGYEQDVFESAARPGVPMTFHTDGTWVWSGAVPYYYRLHHVSPVPQLVQHIRDEGYRVPPVGAEAERAAVAVATGRARPLPPHGSSTVPRPPEIRSLPDEPPLSLLRERKRTTLAPGVEVDRFGAGTGNLVYASRTAYGARSLPPDWQDRPYHTFRVLRPIPAITGVATPWFGQVGGGTGYFLAASVQELLADGSLVEVIGEPPGSRTMSRPE